MNWKYSNQLSFEHILPFRQQKKTRESLPKASELFILYFFPILVVFLSNKIHLNSYEITVEFMRS